MKTQRSFQELMTEQRKYFPETEFTLPSAKPAHTIRTLSIEEMTEAAQEAVVEANAWMFKGKKHE
ncbi:MAG: hypothetical protein WBP46_12985 [Thiolinea sp.]